MEVNAKRSLLARFDAEMRIDPPAVTGFRYERSNGVVRALEPPYRWIVWWSFDIGQCDDAVSGEARTFQTAGTNVEWKVYGHDAPPNLAAALVRNGFVADEPETLMVLDLSVAGCQMPENLPTNFELLRVDDERGLGDFVRVTAQGSARDASWLLTTLPQRLFGVDACAAAFVARVDGQPVGGGRLECPPGRSFASIWGGATIEEFRGRGVFRALVAARVAHAQRAGYPYLLVEARESSRPILERLGSIALTTVVGWNLNSECD